MHYDDEARRFNFISGLVCGVILGSGLALIVAPRSPRSGTGTRHLKKTLKRGRRRYGPQLARLRAELTKAKTRVERAPRRVSPEGTRARRAKRASTSAEV